jgi:hypothetical protein
MTALDGRGERWFEAELHRLRAAALLGCDDAILPTSKMLPQRDHREAGTARQLGL